MTFKIQVLDCAGVPEEAGHNYGTVHVLKAWLRSYSTLALK